MHHILSLACHPCVVQNTYFKLYLSRQPAHAQKQPLVGVRCFQQSVSHHDELVTCISLGAGMLFLCEVLVVDGLHACSRLTLISLVSLVNLCWTQLRLVLTGFGWWLILVTVVCIIVPRCMQRGCNCLFAGNNGGCLLAWVRSWWCRVSYCTLTIMMDDVMTGSCMYASLYLLQASIVT